MPETTTDCDPLEESFDCLVQAVNGNAPWVAALSLQRMGVGLIDCGGVIRAVSAGFAECARSTRDALLGAQVAQVANDPLLLRGIESMPGVRSGFVHRVRPFEDAGRIFGGTAVFDWALKPVWDSGVFAGSLLLVQDVSARNRALESARLKEEGTDSLFAGLQTAVYRCQADWTLESMYGGAALIGYGVDEINALPERFRSLIDPEDLARGVAETVGSPADGSVSVHRYRLIARDGSRVEVEDRRRWVSSDRGGRIEGLLLDARHMAPAPSVVDEGASRALSRVLSTSLDGFVMVAADGRVCDANEAYVRMSGYTREELLTLRISDLDVQDDADRVRERMARIIDHGEERFETVHRRRNGSEYPAEIRVTASNEPAPRFYAFVRDISARRNAEQVLKARVELADLAIEGDRDRLLQTALDHCEALTGSEIGFYHFVDDDEKTLHLQMWSTHTLSTMCTAEGKGQHYPVDQAGIWAACVGDGKPVVCNDYASAPGRQGMPEGHAPVRRFISVPLIRHGRVCAVIGVGNRIEPYGIDEIALIEEVGGFAYDGIEKIVAQEQIADTEAALRLAQRVAHLGSAEIDLVSGEVIWSPEIAALLGVPSGARLDREYFFGRIAGGFREAVSRAWDRLAEGQSFDLEHRVVAPIAHREPFLWMNQRGEVVRWKGDRPLRAVITLQDVTEHKTAQEQIVRLSHFDPLTTLPNRAMFNLRFRHALDKASRRNTRLAVLMLDIDLFKHVNEAMGHGVGDQLLVQVAQRLRDRLRSEDMIARLGGDEFGIILEEIDDPSAAGQVAADLIKMLETPMVVGDEFELSVSASLGISVFPEDAREPEALLANADAALYLAKEQGRKAFRFYRESLTAAAVDRVRLESRLTRALAHHEFLLHYQALWTGDPLRPTGAEALIRWRDPEDGLVPPGKFIGIAEASGLIVPLGRWVLLEACRQMRAWLDEGRDIGTIAVNVSARQFALSDVAADVREALASADLPAKYLEVEITEGVLLEDSEKVIATLTELHAIGVRLAIDDFGTGYSSLMYLKRYPVDKLKIDQSFVRDLPGDAGDTQIVTAIVAMAKAFKLEVLAEGIETEDQFGYLKALGCDAYQGFLLARPVEPDRFPWVVGSEALASGAATAESDSRR